MKSKYQSALRMRELLPPSQDRFAVNGPTHGKRAQQRSLLVIAKLPPCSDFIERAQAARAKAGGHIDAADAVARRSNVIGWRHFAHGFAGWRSRKEDGANAVAALAGQSATCANAWPMICNETVCNNGSMHVARSRHQRMLPCEESR